MHLTEIPEILVISFLKTTFLCVYYNFFHTNLLITSQVFHIIIKNLKIYR